MTLIQSTDLTQISPVYLHSVCMCWCVCIHFVTCVCLCIHSPLPSKQWTVLTLKIPLMLPFRKHAPYPAPSQCWPATLSPIPNPWQPLSAISKFYPFRKIIFSHDSVDLKLGKNSIWVFLSFHVVSAGLFWDWRIQDGVSPIPGTLVLAFSYLLLPTTFLMQLVFLQGLTPHVSRTWTFLHGISGL